MSTIENNSSMHTSSNPWIAVVLLALISTLNLTDRWLPGILADPIKRDLALSDTALGLINGFGFLIIYAAVGIPIARVADRGRYGLVIASCVGLWSVMTALGGLVQTGWQLALTRIGVAIGEAGNSPASHAYISHNFPPERRSAPLAVLTLSSPIALLIGTMVGGLLGQHIGWRMTFVVMGVIGIAIAPVAYFLLRGSGAASGPKIPFTEASIPKASLEQIWMLFRKRSYMLLLAAAACIGMAGYGINAFGPAYLMRSHGLSMGDVALQYGPVQGVLGVSGLLLASAFADRLVLRDLRWPLWVVTSMIAVLTPLMGLSFFSDNKWTAIIGLVLGSVVTVAYQAPVLATMLRLVPADMRATASAVLLFFTATVGGAGPLIIGLISDKLTPSLGPAALSYALLVLIPIMACSGMLFYLASRLYPTEIAPES